MSHAGILRKHLSNFLIVWSFILVILMFFGFMSNAHIGSLTWAPGRDFWSMSIAISKLKYGLKGGIGYRAVSNELAKNLTPNGQDLDASERTKELVDKPTVVNEAIKSAINLPYEDLKPGPIDSGMYITTGYDDFGYAGFYEYAFRIFGFGAYSTHYFYFLIMFSSLILYNLAFCRYKFGMILLISTLASLIFTSSVIFSPYMPNFAASRYLGTLAILPFLHIFVYTFSNYKYNRVQLIYLVLQCLIFGFTVRLRSSAEWMVICFFLLTALVAIYQITRTVRLKNLSIFDKKAYSKETLRFFMVMSFVYLSLNAFNLYEKASLHEIYFSNDLGVSHVFWHNTYIGLTQHPKWGAKIPHPEQINKSGDGVAFILYEIFYKGVPASQKYSPVTKLQRIRIYENLVRQEYLKFAYQNPIYMLELFLIYKPLHIYQYLRLAYASISIKIWIFMIASILGLAACMRGANRKEKSSILSISTIIFLFSLLPEFCTYANQFLIMDPLVTSSILIVILLSMVLCTITDLIKHISNKNINL